MSLAHQLLQLLPRLADLFLHHLPGHAAVRHTCVPQVLRPLTESQVLLRHDRYLLLILPHQVGDIAHRHRKQGPSGDGTKGQRRERAEEDATVPGDDGAGHGGDDDVDAAGEEALAGFGRGGQRGDGVGEGVLDVQGAGEEVVEAVLNGEGVVVEEETGLADLGRQDVSWGRRGGGGRGSLSAGGMELDGGPGRFGDVGWEVIIDGFFLKTLVKSKICRRLWYRNSLEHTSPRGSSAYAVRLGYRATPPARRVAAIGATARWTSQQSSKRETEKGHSPAGTLAGMTS